MVDRGDLVIKAKLAEQAERYEDMVDEMKVIVENFDNLTVEERNLLSVAYKNVIGARRAAWRIISSIEMKKKENSGNCEVTENYKAIVEKELTEIYHTVVKLLDDRLIPNSKSDEEKVFYNKMKGDYCRYKAEYTSGNDRDEASEQSCSAYVKAEEEAQSLPSTHPIRLGLSLNFSVFYYEIKGDSEKACEIAKRAFESGIAELDSLQDDTYKDSTLILQLLRDNLTLWTTDETKEVEDVEQES